VRSSWHFRLDCLTLSWRWRQSDPSETSGASHPMTFGTMPEVCLWGIGSSVGLSWSVLQLRNMTQQRTSVLIKGVYHVSGSDG
jgi:hypothetical protein